MKQINKRGISLIVLVILATAIILRLSNTNIITNANDTVDEYNLKQYEAQMNLAYTSWLADNKTAKLASISELEEYGFKASDLPAGIAVTASVNIENCINHGNIIAKKAAGIFYNDDASVEAINGNINYGDVTGIEEAYGITNIELSEEANCQNYGTVTVTGT